MRHRKLTNRLSRARPEREALFRNLIRGLIISQRIETTLAKAKGVRRLAERLISTGKRDDLHSRRLAFNILRDRDLTAKLFREIAPLFKDRKGGYTRIMHSGVRKGDGAQLAILELTERKVLAPKARAIS